MVRAFFLSGSTITNLMPQDGGGVGHHKFWRRLTDELLFGEHMTHRPTRYLLDLEIENQEFVIVALDCGLRPWRRIKGQADYRADAEEREKTLFSDAESTTRYMAAVGRTGAVLLCTPTRQRVVRTWPKP